MQITIDGEHFDLVSLDDLDFGEQRVLKRLTGGLTIEAITTGLEQLDVDAWFGLILFSIRKVRPDFSAETLERVNFKDLLEGMNASIDRMRAEAAAEADAALEAGSVVPLPAAAEPAAEGASPNGSGSPETHVLHGLPA